FSSSRRHTRSKRDWSSDVCSSDLHRLPRRGHRSARARPDLPRRASGARSDARTRTHRRAAGVHRGDAPDPGRRLPHPDRPVPARGPGGRRIRNRRPARRSHPGRRSTVMSAPATMPTSEPSSAPTARFARESFIIFRRQLRMNLRNPAWVVIGMLQPVLYLLLFGPLLEPLVSQFGATNAYTFFVPGLLVQLGVFGAMFAGFGLIGEWREGVIEAERVTPARSEERRVGEAV